MTVRTVIDQGLGLVITPNFVEAEDIVDALRRFGMGQIIHCRTVGQALDLLSRDGAAPTVTLMSLQEHGEDADRLTALLRAAGSRQILINGHEDHAHARGALFLHRPFSNTELDHCIAQVMERT